MEFLTGDNSCIEVHGKDTRRAKRRDEESKIHHFLYERNGPNVITRTSIRGERTSLGKEDAFDISCDNVSHSLNKGKRWEKAQNAEQILYAQNSSIKTSFVEVTLPAYSPKYSIDASDINAAVLKNRGGVKKYVEVKDGEISVRTAKSNRANLSRLQNHTGPGPFLKKNRKRVRTERNNEEEERKKNLSDDHNEIRYSVVYMKKRDPKTAERCWRWKQPRNSQKRRWTRKHHSDYLQDLYLEQQDDLEAELDASYEENYDCGKSVSDNETFEKQKMLEEVMKLARTKRDVERQRWIRNIAIQEEQSRVQCSSFLSSNYTPRHFCRSVSIHSNDSEKILGVKLNRSTYITSSRVPGRVTIYLVPSSYEIMPLSTRRKYEPEILDVHCIGKCSAKTVKETQNFDGMIDLRHPISSSLHTVDLIMNSKKHFNMAKTADCLPMFPRTIIVHKEQSEKILGTKMDRCIFIAASSVPGEVNLYAAPSYGSKFCCTPIPPLAQPVDGWQAHSRNELETFNARQISPIIPSSTICPYCEKTEEITELEDTVIVEYPHLFSFSCGHVACRSCWLTRARRNVMNRSIFCICINPNCSYTSTTTEAAALFSDATIDIFHSIWWESLCMTKNAVPCISCERILIPLMSLYGPVAICICGERTCIRCHLREHLPLSCSDYNRWSAMCTREGISSPKVPYVPSRNRHLPSWQKETLNNCWSCHSEDTLKMKNWCEKCCNQITILRGDPVKSKEDLVSILSARGTMMNREYRHDINDCCSIDEKKLLDSKKTMADGVFLFELIKISHLIGINTLLRIKMNRNERHQLEELENTLTAILFKSMEIGEDQETKVSALEQIIVAIRNQYYQYV